MRNFNFFEMLWKHGRTLRRVGLVLVMCLMAIPQVWAYKITGGHTIYFDNSIAEWTGPQMQVKQNESNKPVYEFTQIGTTSFYYKVFSTDWDGYDGIYYFNWTGSNWGNKSTYERYDINSDVVIVAKSSSDNTAIGKFTTFQKAYPSNRIYFDATGATGWGDKAYFRYGFDCVAHADPMTKFPGTASLFYIDVNEAYFIKYTIANNAGWTKANTVYQPSSDCKPTGDYAITHSLNFSQSDINGGDSKITTCVITTPKSSTADGCDWYNYTKTGNASIPTQTVTVNSTTNGKIRVDYYNTSGTSTYWEGSGGTSLTVPQSAIITVTAIGNTGYNVNTLSVGGAAFTSGNTYTVTAATTISATFVAKTYSISLNKQQGSSGSTSVTMTYNSSSHTSITAPTAPTGYTFAGWYTGALGTGSMVMNASGVLQANVDGYTGAGGVWKKDGTCTLYAKYTASYPDGYLYITDVKSNPEAGATAAISGATYNASLNGSFAHSGLEYWALVGGSSNTYTLTFASAITASATAAGVAVDVWWGANGTSNNSGTTIYLNGTDAANKIGEAAATSDTRNQLLETLKNVRAVGTTSVSSLQLKRYNANSAAWFRVGIKEIPGYRLTYNVGDGTGAPSASYQPNATITLSSAKPTYAGHLFAGWQVNGSGTVYQPGDSFDMPAEATTLVAKWEENCYQGTITKSSGSLTASHGGEISLTASDATITSGGGIKIVNTNTGSGSVNYDCSSDGMNINTTNGYIEFTLPSGSVLATGSIIRVQGKAGNNSYGLKIIDDSGNEIAKQTNNGAIDFTYTVTAQSAINGNDHVRINRVTNNGTKIKAVTVAGCGSVSCYTPAEPTISGTADYIVGETIELTADITGSNHDSNTEYTWYKGDNWAAASAADPVQDAAKAASNGHIFTKTAAVGDAGTYWCEASNGTGCESHNSTGKAVTVVYKVTYAANGGTGDAMANSTGTSITLSANSYTAPSGYTFDGWRTVSDKQASGTDYAAGTSGITANLDLYAMWKQTVTLDDNGGTKDGSAVVYYNASSASTPSAPTYSGYTADGYYAESGCTNLVMSTAGALTNCTGYVSGGKWVHSGATTLYAHYKCTAPTITCTDNVVTMSTTSSGATIYYTYTTDGSTPSDPTSSNDAYDSENKPVITKDTQFKAIAIESGKTSSAVTSQSCTYTAFSSSVNIEQAVLDNGTSWGYAAALTAANISYDLTPGDGESVSLDNLNYNCSKTDMNNDYRGLKIKSSGKYIEVNLAKGNTLKVRFGHRGSKVSLEIDEVAQSDITKDGNYFTYSLAKDDANNRVVRFTTKDANAVVIKQIMIGEDIATVDLPAQINIADGITNGSISAASTANVGSTVTVTVTPSTGYELATLTYQACTGDPQDINQSTKQFTMPNSKVTLNATFVLSCSAPTSPTITTSTTSYTYGETVSLTASASNTDASTTYAWYLGDPDDSGVEKQAASTSGSTYSGVLNVAESGTYYCVIANSTCTAKASKDITISRASISPTLTYESTTIPNGGSSSTPVVGGNSGSGTVSYSITAASPSGSATVNSSGVVTGAKVGTATVTMSIAQTANYLAGSATADFTIREPILYTVTYSAGASATCKESDTQASEGGSITLATPTWSGYTFQGWYLADTKKGDAGASYTPTANVTLYAKWQGSCAGGGGSGTSVYKFQVKTGLGSSATNIDKTVTDASTYLSVLEGGTLPMSLSSNGDIKTKSDSALCFGSTTGILKPTLTSKSIQLGDIIKYRSSTQSISLMKSTSYDDDTDIILPAGNKMAVTSYGMIGASALNLTKKGSSPEIKYFEIFRPSEVLFFAEVKADMTSGSISPNTDEVEQTTETVLEYISGGRLYTKARSKGYVEITTHEIKLKDGDSGTYIKVTLNKSLAAGDIILINTTNPSYLFGITTSATRSLSITGQYTIPAESDWIGENTIYLWENSSATTMRSMAVVRPNGGSCYTVTYDGNGATSGYTNDPVQYAKDADPVVLDCGYEKTGYAFIGWADGTDHRDAGTVDYQPDDVITDISENKTLYAIWKAIKYFVTEGNWNTDGNWSPSGVPAITDPVVIQANVTVDTDEAKALSVDIESGNTLTIGAGKALIIEKTLTKAGGATAAADVIINSTRAAGTGALIIGGETGSNQATVNFETKVKRESGTGNWINQFIGSPFSDLKPYVDYALQIYKFMPAGGGNKGFWHKLSSGNEMEAFWGYNVLYNDNEFLDVTWTGTLNASSNNVTKTGSNAVQTDNLFANSWVAPIHIAEFEEDDFTNFDATIYIFNAGTPQQEDAAGGIGSGSASASDPGTYAVLPIDAAPWVGMEVIPAMQAFFVKATGASPSIKLDYSKLVYTPALTSVDITPTRAPRRSAEVAPEVIRLHVAGENGWAETTYLLGREDFTEGFDNGWDGRYMEGEDTNPQLYAPTSDGNMAVNCVPQIEGTLLGFRKGNADSQYTFTFEYAGDEDYYLKDLKLDIETPIDGEHSYAFTAEAGDNVSRFIIVRKTPTITTGTAGIESEISGARKVIYNNKVYIIRGGRIYSVDGAVVR